MIRVVVDAMGSDFGSLTIVQGVCQYSLEEDVHMILVGDEKTIEDQLQSFDHVPERISIIHASKEITMHDSPRVAVPESSIYVAADLVRKGEGDALISAGNTGAVVVCASRSFQRLEGVNKVALATVYPTRKTHGPKKDPFALLLDVGATLHVEAHDLVCFAIMGTVYAQIISDNPHPKVALLSNGEEPTKGSPEVVEAHQILAAQDVLHFIGNVEGVDIPKGSADVVVCEGFLGNVILKFIEGIGEFASVILRSAGEKSGTTIDEPLYQQVRRVAELTDWKHYGGAPILGLDQVVIKAHGRSTARAIRNAVKLAKRAVERDMIPKIQQGMENILS